VLAAAPRIGVGSRPRAAVSADIDGDGDLDLAVANLDSSTVSILRNDGAGGFEIDRTLTVAGGPDSIVAADLNRDGRVDLALNAPLAAPPGVSILLGSTTAPGGFAATVVAVGTAPGDLALGDFDKDGDLDLAVCDAVMPPQAGHVRILSNDGDGVFTPGPSADVASQPTAIAAADFDGDGDLDLAVGNVGSDNVQILTNTAGSFLVSRTLVLPGTDLEPVSVAAADFDADGDPDLAVAAYAGDHLHLYRNDNGTLTSTPVVSRDAPYLLQSVTAADVNLDGRPDLLAVATGLTVFRGRGALDFEPPDTVVAGWSPWFVAVGDFSRDGWPDLAVVNEGSSDVSLLISTPCRARRLEVTLQSAACQIGPPPYGQPAEARAYDEGGNPATCAGGTVIPSIVPGTGDPLAVLGGSGSGGLPLTDGVASFTGLTIDWPGRRYRLQFSLGALPPAQTRSFTLGPELQIVGTSSICPNGSVTFSTREGYYDEYAWTLTPSGVVPPAYTPTVTLRNPPVTGAYTLGVSARVDACSLQATRPIYGGLLQSTALAIQGLSTVCLDCIGGTITPTDVGGGLPQSRQWGYRTAPGLDPVVDMPAETGETYVLKGSSFPAPGTYYVVVTTVPTCGAPRVSSEIAVTVITSVPTGEVQHLAASARGSNALGGQVGLQWVNSTGAAEEVRVRWNKAPNGTRLCLPPSDTVSPATDEASITSPSAGVKDGFAHAGLVFDTTYCYSVFVMVGSVWSPGRTVEARPFNADDGPIKWSYSTGATAVVPPVVGFGGILAMSNDRTLHSVTRGGTTGGVWPEGWVPYALTGVVHSRSPIVPFATTSPVFPGRSILFAGDDAGDVHAVDASSGQPAWPGPRPQGKPVVGAPGGFFRQYSGVADLIIVGTRGTSGPNELRALAVADGSLVGTPYTAGGTIGAISGSPAIDYATQRIYFTSRSYLGTGATIWCVQVDGSTPFTPAAAGRPATSGRRRGPVLRGGRVYFGTVAGIVYSLDARTGLDDRTFATGDGPVKGFVFLDRRNDDLIFATDNRVWSVSDTGAATMPENWQWTDAANGLNPSVVLYWPQTNYVYVGSKDDRLYELDFANAGPTPPSHKVLALGDALAQIGAPSLDIGVVPPDVTPGKKLLVVGSESGVLYGVEVPF
jgi:outer membrane protein assembly factor BamB